ncbi:AT hook motif family protein, putative [Ichthyophthirius multifiliis]|uniref:AT hook motif family protein, putative n=1 Tax=Ichthyophthirius multifiliis TaxID=5932 RepID=G0R1W2_ICHMU|nr:AT hook motif family protein, putative [Ichthyophthirius multifiliis]EGR28535.1 AT hook motif family protein, putative [Ichthyophthirius multifiliis]|eukprot:XP_004029771.1 AT hook motif family protein, putative [Ichthyophthirius multifiliis]
MLYEQKNSIPLELIQTVEDYFPNGISLAQSIEYFAFQNPNLLALYQILLMSEFLINCDQAGRLALSESIKKLLLNMKGSKILQEVPQIETANDVFYQWDMKNLKEAIFGQTYYDFPIITCCYELIPLCVRILKKSVLDVPVNVFITQIISEVHEPLAKDSDNDTHLDLPSELTRVQKQIIENNVQLEILEQKLNKRVKQKDQYQIEVEKEQKNKILENLRQKENVLNEQIFDIQMKEIILVQNLLINCIIDTNDPSIKNLLQQIIIPSLKQNSNNLRCHSLKALALYVLIDRNYCNDFFNVFLEFLQKNEDEDNLSIIISLRSIVDFILLYDFAKNPSQSDDIDISLTQDLILQQGFQANYFVRNIAIEGLCKLLLNNKLQDPQNVNQQLYIYIFQKKNQIICLLIILWFDNRKTQKESYKSVQILTLFFKTYTSMNYSNLLIFEKALELYIGLITQLKQKDLTFDYNSVLIDHTNELFITKSIRVCISLLSKQNVEAQLILFSFFCQKACKNKDFVSLFEKICQYFDFFEKGEKNEIFNAFQHLNFVLDNIPPSKTLNSFLKVLKNSLKNEQFEENNNFQKNLNDQSLQEVQLIIKQLKEFNIIIKDTDEQKKQRVYNKQQDDDESKCDEEQKTNLEENQDEEEKEEDEENEIQEEEEEEEQQEEEDDEEEDNQDEDEEEENQDEEENQEEEEEDEEEENQIQEEESQSEEVQFTPKKRKQPKRNTTPQQKKKPESKKTNNVKNSDVKKNQSSQKKRNNSDQKNRSNSCQKNRNNSVQKIEIIVVKKQKQQCLKNRNNSVQKIRKIKKENNMKIINQERVKTRQQIVVENTKLQKQALKRKNEKIKQKIYIINYIYLFYILFFCFQKILKIYFQLFILKIFKSKNFKYFKKKKKNTFYIQKKLFLKQIQQQKMNKS